MVSFQSYLQLIAVNSCLSEDILRSNFGLQVNILFLSSKLLFFYIEGQIPTNC